MKTKSWKHMWSRIASAAAVVGVGATVAVACGGGSSANGSGSSNGNGNGGGGTCLTGSEACPCTQGGTCDPGLSCLSNLCVDVPTGGAGGVGGGSGSVGGAGSSASASSGTGVGSTTGTGGQAPVTMCPFPADMVTAKEQSDPQGTSKDPLAAEFSNGTLVKLDGKACVHDTSGIDAEGDWGSYPCRDAYSCGGCLVFVIGPDGPNAVGTWFLVGAYSGTNGMTAGCPQISGVYEMCAPDCGGGNQCGDDGCGFICGSCPNLQCCDTQNTCVNDGCASCLDACQGLMGCCTGVGCICDSACPGPC